MTADLRAAVDPAAPTTARVCAPRAGRVSLRVLRVVAVLHALVLLAQPVLAGRYLDGSVEAISWHRSNAFVVTAFDVVQLSCAIVFAWRGRGRRWPIWASLAIAVGIEVQVGFGFERIMVVHAPLGVTLITAQIVVVVWLFRAGAEAARPATVRPAGADPAASDAAGPDPA